MQSDTSQSSTEPLRLLGLTEKEAKVLRHLLGQGPCSAGQIADALKFHRTSAYDLLAELVRKGLVAYIDSDTRVFSAARPETILHRMEHSMQDAAQLLKGMVQDPQSIVNVSVSEGLDAQRAAMLELVEKGEQIDILGLPNDASERIGPALDAYHQRRIERKLHSRHIYNGTATERIKWLNSLPHTEARWLPGHSSPATTIITGSLVILRFWGKEPFFIRIESKELAAEYRKYFEFIWERAKA